MRKLLTFIVRVVVVIAAVALTAVSFTYGCSHDEPPPAVAGTTCGGVR